MIPNGESNAAHRIPVGIHRHLRRRSSLGRHRCFPELLKKFKDMDWTGQKRRKPTFLAGRDPGAGM